MLEPRAYDKILILQNVSLLIIPQYSNYQVEKKEFSLPCHALRDLPLLFLSTFGSYVYSERKVHIMDDTKKKTFNFKHWIKYYDDVPIETFFVCKKSI